jgi:hypothetical protein
MNIYLPVNVRPMKKKHKIQLDCHLLEFIIPGAGKLDEIPRKQKKALKKKIAIDLLKYINEHSEELIQRLEASRANS